jgi:pimeloyl-ACP methyl ester carboxylesterase
MQILERLAAGALLLSMPWAALAAPAAGADGLPAIACTASERRVEAEGFAEIGGIEQWVTVRGADCGNPILLFVHGGPGNPTSAYPALFADWERDFTIVQWDQRGAGRTFGRNPHTAEAPLSLERMTADGTAIAEFVAGRLGQPRVILVGSSWGSALAVHMARARRGLFLFYVGISQLVGGRENMAASYRETLAAARSAGDGEAASAIEALGPPPWTNPRNFGILRRLIRRFERESTDPPPPAWWVPAPLYATPEAMAAYEAGEDYSFLQFVGPAGDGLLWGLDLPALGTRFELPVFLVQGEADLLTVPEVSRRYFDSLEAPAKQFVLVPRAGHDPNSALMDAAYRLLIEQARPRNPSTSSDQSATPR